MSVLKNMSLVLVLLFLSFGSTATSDSGCTDNNQHCPYYASHWWNVTTQSYDSKDLVGISECDRDPSWVLTNCKLSCEQNCTEVPTSAPTATPSTGTPTATPSTGTPTATLSTGTPTATPSTGTPTATPSSSPTNAENSKSELVLDFVEDNKYVVLGASASLVTLVMGLLYKYGCECCCSTATEGSLETVSDCCDLLEIIEEIKDRCCCRDKDDAEEKKNTDKGRKNTGEIIIYKITQPTENDIETGERRNGKDRFFN